MDETNERRNEMSVDECEMHLLNLYVTDKENIDEKIKFKSLEDVDKIPAFWRIDFMILAKINIFEFQQMMYLYYKEYNTKLFELDAELEVRRIIDVSSLEYEKVADEFERHCESQVINKYPSKNLVKKITEKYGKRLGGEKI